MKINYEFVDGNKVEIEVSDDIAKVILEMTREERNQTRRNRYYERHLDTNADYGSWNEYIQPEFDPCREEREEQKRLRQIKAVKALSSLNDCQMELVIALYGDTPIKAKEYAKKIGVSPAAITNRTNKIRKKLKKYL